MPPTALHTDSPPAVRPAAARKGRHSPVPDAPSFTRRELEVFEEVDGALGFVLWRVISDVLVWARAAAHERAGLLAGGGTPAALLEDGLALAQPVAGELRSLAALDAAADPARVAAACSRVAEWAEAAELKGVALQFAEAAAWAEPESSAFAWAAGRLCRRMGEFERAKQWLRRALRLARRGGNEIDFANAHRGLGFVLVEQGRFTLAEPHFWKSVRAAMRVGRKSLAGAAYHDLLLVAVHQGRWDDALAFATRASEHYKANHPRFPILVHDVGYFWSRRGFHSSALPLYERIAPLVDRYRERILVFASIARSAAVVRDNLRFERAAAKVVALAAEDEEMSAASIYQIGEGARCFEDWARAEALGEEALALALRRGNATVEAYARGLIEAATQHRPGERDRVPDEGGIVDRTREILLGKLRRRRPPEDGGQRRELLYP